MADVLFPLGIRLSTWVVLALFLALGVRDRRFWLAGAAWIGGFETVFQATVSTRELADSGLHARWWVPVVVFGMYALGIAFLVFAARHGARPSLPLLGVAGILWAVWIATGFHVNEHTTVGFDAGAEALNEGFKTALAAAYLVPLWVEIGPRGRRTGPRSRFGSPAAANAVATDAYVREEQRDKDNGEDDVQDHRASRKS